MQQKDARVNEETLARIENRMKELVSQNLPIEITQHSGGKKRSNISPDMVMIDRRDCSGFAEVSSVNVYLLDGL